VKSYSTQELLKRVFSQPTAPFREGFVRSEVRRILSSVNIPHFMDKAGNLIAGVNSFKEIRSGFRIALMAHMDHPGYHLDKRLGTNIYQCRWYGGAPWPGMNHQAVRLHDPLCDPRAKVEGARSSVRGQILPISGKLAAQADGRIFKVRFERDISEFSDGSFGGFDFPAFQRRGDLIYTRAADDLAGCVIALGAVLDQEAERRKRKVHALRPLLAIFTRAEEVGFVGCSDLLKQNVLPKDNLWLVSLEASKTLPGAELGKGPVLRIGDRVSLFDSEFSSVLWEEAKELQKKTRFQFQRRLMDGGTCEATPLSLAGYSVTAIAVPLLNYHNCGPGDRPAAEAISLKDTHQARRLCLQLSRSLKSRPEWKKQRLKEIAAIHRLHENRLRTKISYHGESPP